MTACRQAVLAAFLGTALAACTQLVPPATAPRSADAQPAPPHNRRAVTAREHLSPRFIALIGAKRQHAPPFLDIAGTNFYCLRSFIDRATGATEHQLYVSDSYSGAERNWNAAHDGMHAGLSFVPISHDEISCAPVDLRISFARSAAEEFAATIPASALRMNSGGLAVTFTAGSRDGKTILVSADQIAAQLAAVDGKRSLVQPAAALAAPAPSE